MHAPKVTFSYWGLLAAQLGMLVLAPALERIDGARLLTDLLFASLLLFAVWSISHDRRATLITAVAGVLTIIGMTLVNHGVAGPAWSTATFSVAAMMLGWIAVVIFGDVFFADRVTTATIIGAICVYILIGLIFGFVYSAIQTLQPGAFDSRLTGGAVTQLIYFSMVTLTTLGYGDVTPVAAIARGLVIIEAILGQVYLAVLMARLVGLHLTQKRTGE